MGKLRTDAADHHPLIVVAGEAGVGKTRFVEEACSRVSKSGYRVLSGGCINLGDAYPYAPFVEALRDLASLRPGGQVNSLEVGDGDLARFLFPVAHPTTTEPTTGLSYTSPQASLFEGLLRLLVQLTETSPLLLSIEDLHWADRSS
ncbi:MAG TPA: ATP-binding protein, partial [Acidimicrobiia bacterium]|nr:ATP-binding protein [Acidimicrobiia bacterium]